MAHVVIIGAGLTGLSTAYHLEKDGFFDYKIVEKDSTIGGLCRSVTQDGFTFDYTGHLLHASDPYFRSLIYDILGQEYFNAINRRSYIYSHHLYTNYPFQMNLYGLPTDVITECIEGYVKRRKTRKKVLSFYDWVLGNFGKGIARHFFFPFQQKIFDYNLNNISASWTGRFVPSTSLHNIVEGALKQIEQDVGYNAHFLYPKKGGIFSWVYALSQQIINPIITHYCVKKIDLKNKIIMYENGDYEPYKIIINTMPLDCLINCLEESSHLNLATTSNKLLCNSVINFNLGIARPNISDKHWIYFPESQYPFYRLGFAHNFSQNMAPDGCSSLYGEFAHLKKSTSYVKKKLKQSLISTKKLLSIADNEIITQKIISIPHAYVIYDFWREKYLPRILQLLQDQSIYSVGRYGAWKYSSMQEAILDGKKIAEVILTIPSSVITTYQKVMPIPKPAKQKEFV